MNLIWHLVKKDLRRTRIPLALYAAFVVTKLVLAALLVGALELDRFRELFDYLKIAVMAEFAIGYVLVAAIVQEDPLVGTTAFWMTKPISGIRLLAAKLIVLATGLVLLPLVLTLPWWFHCGFGLPDLPQLIGGLLVPQTILLLLGLPFAVLTRNLSRYLACTLVTVLVWFVFVVNLAGRSLSRDRELLLGLGAAETRNLIVIAITIGSVIAAVVYQYRTRRSPRSAAIVVIGFVLATLVLGIWRWDWSPLWKASSPLSRLGAAVQLEFQSAELRTASPVTGPFMHVRAQLAGVPTGHKLANLSIRQEWQSPDGTKTVLASQQTSGPSDGDLLMLPVNAGDGGRVEEGSSGTPSVREIFSSGPFPASLVPESDRSPLALKLTVRTRLLRPVLLGEAHLETNATLSSHNRTLRIVDTGASAENEIMVSASEISLPGETRFDGEPKFYLFDRAAHRVLWSTKGHSDHIAVAGVSIAGHTMTFTLRSLSSPANRPPSFILPSLDRLRLARVAFEIVGDVCRTTELSHVAVKID